LKGLSDPYCDLSKAHYSRTLATSKTHLLPWSLSTNSPSVVSKSGVQSHFVSLFEAVNAIIAWSPEAWTSEAVKLQTVNGRKGQLKCYLIEMNKAPAPSADSKIFFVAFGNFVRCWDKLKVGIDSRIVSKETQATARRRIDAAVQGLKLAFPSLEGAGTTRGSTGQRKSKTLRIKRGVRASTSSRMSTVGNKTSAVMSSRSRLGPPTTSATGNTEAASSHTSVFTNPGSLPGSSVLKPTAPSTHPPTLDKMLVSFVLDNPTITTNQDQSSVNSV
jgi:hypothetical protein